MDKIPVQYKKIPPNEDLFYKFFLGNGRYVLYDSGMGDPVAYGSINKVDAPLNEQCEKIKVGKRRAFYVLDYVMNNNDGWKLDPAKPNEMQKNPPPNFMMGKGNFKIPKLKNDWSLNEKQFYWFDMKDRQVLYDSDMGTPVSYGSNELVKGSIKGIAKAVREGKHSKCIIWYFKREMNGQWKKHIMPITLSWTLDDTEKRNIVNEKKNSQV